MHDVVLLLTIGASALLSFLYLALGNLARRLRYLLALFFLTNALISAHTLIYWGEAIRYRVFDAFPYAFLLLSFTCFAVGPLLYWQTSTTTCKDFRISRLQWLHLLPAILAPVYYYTVCFRFDTATQRELLFNFGLYGQAKVFYFHYVSLEKLVPLIYGIVCIHLLRSRAKANELPLAGSAISTLSLTILAYGFALMWLWVALTHFLGLYLPEKITDLMGIAGNYFNLVLVLFLIVDQIKYAASSPKPEKQKVESLEVNAAHIARIQNAMEAEKVFLNPQLTLERFADSVALNPREVSTVVNRKFQQNFHEFVNAYRVDEAKQMLRNPAHYDANINDIAHASGFNSKATFNRFFKKFVLTTPSDYRRKHQTLEP